MKALATKMFWKYSTWLLRRCPRPPDGMLWRTESLPRPRTSRTFRRPSFACTASTSSSTRWSPDRKSGIDFINLNLGPKTYHKNLWRKFCIKDRNIFFNYMAKKWLPITLLSRKTPILPKMVENHPNP
jgi:hypothetical protein